MEETQRCWDEHPDLVLARQEERRGICCLALCGATQEQICALAELGAFCVYREGENAAQLYAHGLPVAERHGSPLSTLGGHGHRGHCSQRERRGK